MVSRKPPLRMKLYKSSSLTPVHGASSVNDAVDSGTVLLTFGDLHNRLDLSTTATPEYTVPARGR